MEREAVVWNCLCVNALNGTVLHGTALHGTVRTFQFQFQFQFHIYLNSATYKLYKILTIDN